MGNFLNTMMRFLCGKSEDEEGERGVVRPYPVLSQRYSGDRYSSTTSFFERLRKILSIHKLLYNGAKMLFQKLRNIFQRKPAEPILPVKIAAPKVSRNYPVLGQALLIKPQNVPSLKLREIPEKVIITSIVPDRLTISDQKDERKRKEENKNGSVSVVVEKGRIRCIKHYNSSHRILIVGDGDFSFSSALARAFESASNMISTSLDPKEFLEKNYHKFMSNIKELKSRGCKVMHGIDATKMASHELLRQITFDRIIYNFPFAGFFKELSRESQLRLHRRLVTLFLKNAKEMISKDGEIHISHKTNGFHAEWNMESIASSHGFRLIEAVDFNHLDYPGYNTKCGFGGDNNFNCYPSKTYKFRLKTARY